MYARNVKRNNSKLKENNSNGGIKLSGIQVTIEGVAKTLSKKDYIKMKHEGLIKFGYDNLTEKEVEEQLEAVLEGKEFGKGLDNIGMFIQKDKPIIVN